MKRNIDICVHCNVFKTKRSQIWSGCYSLWRSCKRNGDDYNAHKIPGFCKLKLEHIVINNVKC